MGLKGLYRTTSEIQKSLKLSRKGGQNFSNKSKTQIRTFENRWGGGGIFQKSLNFKYLDHMGLYGLYRTTSEIKKSLKLIRKGGVSNFHISQNSKNSKISHRGGSSLFWKKSKIFPFFNYDASPCGSILDFF